MRALAQIVRGIAKQPSGALGLSLVAAHLAIALLAPILVQTDPAAQNADAMMAAPSQEHWFGTDRLGRDVFARTMLGGQAAMLISTVATLVALLWGGLLGIVIALIGGKLDAIVMRCADAFMAIPWILLVMLFVAALGSGTTALIPVLGFSYGLSVVYLARSATLDFVVRDFVLAAQARGQSRWTIATVELLPNVRDSLAVQGAMQWSWIFLAVSSLSYLGMGVSPPTPDWGQMIADGRGVMQTAPWSVIFPIVALSSLIIGINLVVDAAAKELGIDRVQQAGAR